MQIKAKLVIDSIYRRPDKPINGIAVPCILASGTLYSPEAINVAHTSGNAFELYLARNADGSDPVRVGQEFDVTIYIPDAPLNDGRLDQSTQMP